MFASDFVTFDSWEGMVDLQRQRLGDMLRARVRETLKKGVHAFGSRADLFRRLGVEELDNGQIEMPDTRLKSFPVVSSSQFKMSWDRFVRLVSDMEGVKFEDFECSGGRVVRLTIS